MTFAIVHGHARNRTAGRSGTYNSWRAMRERCYYPPHPRFVDYGGRGIMVCDRWTRFAAFLADMGERPPGLTLDRINPDDHYYPGNCRWATPIEQAWNRRTIGAALHDDTPPLPPPAGLFTLPARAHVTLPF